MTQATSSIARREPARTPLLQQIWIHKRLYLYIAPTLLLLITFSYWPAFSALFHAFYDWNPFTPPKWIGLKNFQDVYDDMFRPAVGLCPVCWALTQWLAWAGTGLFIGFFMAVEAVEDRKWAWLTWPACAMLGAAMLLTLGSLINGLTDWTFLRTHDLLSWFLIDHLGLLAAGALQFYGWRRYVQSGKSRWWSLLAVGTVAAICFGFGLLLNMSTGGDLRASCWNLVRVMSFGLTIGLFMPLLIAEILFHLRSERWKYLYRVLFVVPMVVPGIIGVLMWQFIYDPNFGVLKQLINALREPPMQFVLLCIVYLLALYLSVMAVLARRRRFASAGWAGILTIGLLALPVLALAGYGIEHITSDSPRGIIAAACAWSGMSWLTPALKDVAPNWLGDEKIALYSIMFMGFPWVGTISMLIFYAGLQAIPESVLESAKLDGATGLRRFFTIEFPLILGQFKLLLILGIIGGIQGFQNVLILTYGGPNKATDMPGMLMFREAFDYGKLGYGTTVGVAMFLVILAVTYVNMKYIRPSAEEESR